MDRDYSLSASNTNPKPDAPYGYKADGTARLKANSFTKRRDTFNAEDHRKRIKTGMLMTRLSNAASGKLNLTAAQVQAAKVLLDKALPSLQSVETMNIDAAATMSEAEIKEQITKLLDSNPDILASYIARQAQNTPQLHTIPDPTTQAPESKQDI